MTNTTHTNHSTDVIKAVTLMSLAAQHLVMPEEAREASDDEGKKSYLMFGRTGANWRLVAADLLDREPPHPADSKVVETGDAEGNHVLVELSAAVKPAFVSQLFDSADVSDDQQKLIKMLLADSKSIWYKF